MTESWPPLKGRIASVCAAGSDAAGMTAAKHRKMAAAQSPEPIKEKKEKRRIIPLRFIRSSGPNTFPMSGKTLTGIYKFSYQVSLSYLLGDEHARKICMKLSP